MSLVILNFLINGVSRSRNRFRPQLIRYGTSVDADAPNQSLATRCKRVFTLLQGISFWVKLNWLFTKLEWVSIHYTEQQHASVFMKLVKILDPVSDESSQFIHVVCPGSPQGLRIRGKKSCVKIRDSNDCWDIRLCLVTVDTCSNFNIYNQVLVNYFQLH